MACLYGSSSGTSVSLKLLHFRVLARAPWSAGQVFWMSQMSTSLTVLQPTGRRTPKPRPNPAPKTQNPAKANRRRKTTSTNNNNTSRRSRKREPSVPWFLLAELAVDSATPAGQLENMLLHPSNFPRTPYASVCSNYAYREEFAWEFRIIVTTAANTGFRGAIILVPDPTQQAPPATSSIIWSAIMNKSGAWMSSTGTGESRVRIKTTSATRRLSNARPQHSDNWTGFATGSLVVYLVDPPIGLAQTATGNTVRVTILARPELRCYQPIAGWLDWTQTEPTPGPGPSPQPSSFRLQFTATASMADVLNDHQASAWLAGGYYLDMTQLVRNTQQPWLQQGELWAFSIYICNPRARDWQDNDSATKEPGFFVTWQEPASSVVQLVGFEDLKYARYQADEQTGSIPHGAECCICYHTSDIPSWQDRWTGVTATIDFQLVYKGPKAYRVDGRGSSNNPQGPVGWPTQPMGRQVPAVRARSSPTGPAQPSGTLPSSGNPAPTSETGLHAEINNLRSVVTDLWTTLMLSGIQPTSYSERLLLSRPPTPAPSWIGSSVDNENYSSTPPAYPNNWPHLTPGCAAQTASCNCSPSRQNTPPLDLISWSSLQAPTIDATAPPTGSALLPNISALPSCPGCDNENCDDCFEDELVETVVDAEQLTRALSLLSTDTAGAV